MGLKLKWFVLWVRRDSNIEVVCSYSLAVGHDLWKIAPFLFLFLFCFVLFCVCVLFFLSILLKQRTVIREVALSLAAQQS